MDQRSWEKLVRAHTTLTDESKIALVVAECMKNPDLGVWHNMHVVLKTPTCGCARCMPTTKV